MSTAMFVCNVIRSKYTGFPSKTSIKLLLDIFFWYIHVQDSFTVCMHDKIGVSVCICAHNMSVHACCVCVCVCVCVYVCVCVCVWVGVHQ